jgi:hypothetical protein
MRIIAISLLLWSMAWSQVRIAGVIRDKETGHAIPSANIQIMDSFRGTVSNLEGRFQIAVDGLPVRLRISHIGYQSLLVAVTSKTEQIVDLVPAVVKMPDMVITAEDPAFNIMRKVIARKKERQDRLRNFVADAYTRLRVANDTAVVMIAESTSRLYWDSKKGTREKTIAKLQTLNMDPAMRGPQAGHLPNLGDDNIEMYGFKLIGPTHPDALDYYDFKLEGRRSQDGRIVYDIAVIPKTNMQPCFSGSLSVLDQEYALLSVDVTSRNIHPQEFYLQELSFSCRQQFSRFDSLYWLPVDFNGTDRVRFGIPGLQFPGITATRISSLDHYSINSEIADSVFAGQEMTAAPRQVSNDSLLAFSQRAVPLTLEEARAYRIIDSSMTVDKAFKPKGYLARHVRIQVKSRNAADSGKARPRWRSTWSPLLGFNRVDGGQLGLAAGVERAGFSLHGFGQYYTSSSPLAKGIDVRLQNSALGWFVASSWADQTAAAGSKSIYAQQMTAVAALLGQPDYANYFRNEEFCLDVGKRLKKSRLLVAAGFARSQQTSLKTSTDFSLIKRMQTKRDNPAINDGRFHTIHAQIEWGENDNTLGTIGQSGWSMKIEQSLPSLGSDASFTRLEGQVHLHLPTFYRRYLFPNSLDILLRGGTSKGQLPEQSSFSLDGRLFVLAPFGAMKTMAAPWYGHRYAAFYWEHNFRGMPLQWIGLTGLADKGIHLLIHGGSARVWSRRPEQMDDFYHETGISVNGLLTYVRCDVTVRWHGNRAVFVTLAPRKIF